MQAVFPEGAVNAIFPWGIPGIRLSVVLSFSGSFQRSLPVERPRSSVLGGQVALSSLSVGLTSALFPSPLEVIRPRSPWDLDEIAYVFDPSRPSGSDSFFRSLFFSRPSMLFSWLSSSSPKYSNFQQRDQGATRGCRRPYRFLSFFSAPLSRAA